MFYALLLSGPASLDQLQFDASSNCLTIEKIYWPFLLFPCPWILDPHFLFFGHIQTWKPQLFYGKLWLLCYHLLNHLLWNCILWNEWNDGNINCLSATFFVWGCINTKISVLKVSQTFHGILNSVVWSKTWSEKELMRKTFKHIFNFYL